MDHTVFTCKQHHACLSFVSFHQMAPPQQLRQQTSNCSLLLIYRPRNDERLSWPSWLTYSGWFTHISGHPSATDREQDSESTPAKDRRSTAGPRNRRSGVALAMRHTLKWFIHLHILLRTPRDPIITTRLRSANKFPRLPSRTRKYQTFISYGLAHYQTL